jgi:hypothetical protein
MPTRTDIAADTPAASGVSPGIAPFGDAREAFVARREAAVPGMNEPPQVAAAIPLAALPPAIAVSVRMNRSKTRERSAALIPGPSSSTSMRTLSPTR